MAKCFMPGLRVGFVAAPKGKAERVGASVRATVRMTAPLMAEVVAGWVEDGTAPEIAEHQRQEVEARQAIARPLLAEAGIASNPLAFHIWLPLPAQWTGEAFVTAARRRDVLFMPSDPFVVGKGNAPRYVRICLGAPMQREDVERGIRVIADLLGQPSTASMAVV
jgi:DNA-binding transcriptional MocR family regulator